MQLQLSLTTADRLHEALLVRGKPFDAAEAAQLLLASANTPAPVSQAVLGSLVKEDERFCWDDQTPARISLTAWEMPDPYLEDVPFVALDLETTGARAGAGKITEIGAVRIEGMQEVARFNTLVNPLRSIPPMIMRLTGITNEMVAHAPRIEEVLPAVLKLLEGAIVVAHNAPFDVGFLNYELQRFDGRRLGEGAIDTLPLSRALAPGLPNYRLHTVADALGAPVVACHRALADAQAVSHVFVTLMARLQERGVTRVGELRSYLNPGPRSALSKLALTRDLPDSPGTYRFTDKRGKVLYIGKADRLSEEVRSHFVAGADHPRKVRQATRLVERIEWEEARTPLEAVAEEQRLILEHRPSCNMWGIRPETYMYLKAGGGRPGLSLFASSRPPKWLQDADDLARPAPGYPLAMGPFRGRARLRACLDLLQHCYPIRRCPRKSGGRPCARAESNQCLAPCTGDPERISEHDGLVMRIIAWLAGCPNTDLCDPVARAEALSKRLARQRRHDQVHRVKEACRHLLSIRGSYASLAEAGRLHFAVLWPQPPVDGVPSLRLNLVYGGRLLKPQSLYPDKVEEAVERALRYLWDGSRHEAWGNCTPAVTFQPKVKGNSESEFPTPALTAVRQQDLDLLLAIRGWFHNSPVTPKIPIPPVEAGTTAREEFRIRLINEADSLLATQPSYRARTASPTGS